jgi:hypothetical protein
MNLLPVWLTAAPFLLLSLGVLAPAIRLFRPDRARNLTLIGWRLAAVPVVPLLPYFGYVILALVSGPRCAD